MRMILQDSHPQIETRSTYNQVTRTPSTSSVTTVTQSDNVSPIQSSNVMPDGGPMMGATTHQEESMDITTSGNNIYYGEYPDFVLPLPG